MDELLYMFEYEHRPVETHYLYKPFYDMAHHIVNALPLNRERSVALRKLLESKDAAVRCVIYKDRLKTFTPK